MAFPTNPTDGQIHGGYRYNSAKEAWEKITPLNTEKVNVDGQYEIVYNENTESLDFNYIGD